jgi:hypothetical protein
VPAYDLCLFERIEGLALEILLRTNRQHLLVADLPYNHRQCTSLATLDADAPPSHPPAVTVDHIVIAMINQLIQFLTRPRRGALGAQVIED